MPLRLKRIAQRLADEARCACDQNGGQGSTMAMMIRSDERLDAIGSLWQTDLMLHE